MKESDNTRSFSAGDAMRAIIHEEPQLLMVLRRFDISLGFGNATVEQICAGKGIDTDTFLAVANYTTGREWKHFSVDVNTLMRYLKNAHKYFLGFALPVIRRKLLEALPVQDPHAITMLILKYFDDFADEVRAHMNFEDENVFPYIEMLLRGELTDRFDITAFESSHKPLAPKLQELKEIFVSHYRSIGNEDLINATLFDIINCENDIAGHCAVEDHILVPAVEAIVARNRRADGNDDTKEATGAAVEISQRECEVVRCIAMGMSTKEIADHLCLSAHTVNTHRRNICAKLDIHSTAGLAIYAIIHNLVDIADIRSAALK